MTAANRLDAMLDVAKDAGHQFERLGRIARLRAEQAPESRFQPACEFPEISHYTSCSVVISGAMPSSFAARTMSATTGVARAP